MQQCLIFNFCLLGFNSVFSQSRYMLSDNIAYLNLENYFEILKHENEITGILIADSVIIKDTKWDDGSFTYKPTRLGEHMLHLINKKDTVNFIIKVKELPLPEILISGERQGKYIPIKTINNNKGFVVKLLDVRFSIDTRFYLKEYDVNILREGKSICNIKETTAMFSRELKDCFSSLKSGDLILISNIKAGISGKDKYLALPAAVYEVYE